jgi:hypothetical protein
MKTYQLKEISSDSQKNWQPEKYLVAISTSLLNSSEFSKTSIIVLKKPLSFLISTAFECFPAKTNLRPHISQSVYQGNSLIVSTELISEKGNIPEGRKNCNHAAGSYEKLYAKETPHCSEVKEKDNK